MGQTWVKVGPSGVIVGLSGVIVGQSGVVVGLSGVLSGQNVNSQFCVTNFLELDIRCYLSVCTNGNNDLYNIWGTVGCGDNCRVGYEGDDCNECSNLYFPVNGTNHEVDSTTGEGVTCQSITYVLHFCVFS